MARTARLLSALAVTTLVAVTGAAGATPAVADRGGHRPGYALTTKTPYAPQGSIAGYQRAPRGFVPVFTENVSRHGERTLSDSDDGDALLSLWTTAEQEHALTARGRGLGPEIERLLAANAKVGYGLLTGSGKRELRSTAVRSERRLPGVFGRAATAAGTGRTRIAVLSSSQPRAIESAASYVQGLVAADPRLATVIAPDVPDDALLYFHKAAVNKDYQDYVKHDPRVAAAESAVLGSRRTAVVSRDILSRSFSRSFVARIAAGEFGNLFAGTTEAAEAVYDLWAVTKDMPDEGRWHMGRYLGSRNAAWFGYLDDVTSFYENGPGFAGDDITYKMASVLLDDLFARLDAKRDGTSSLDAVLRFTHAEVVFPLAALLQLPGSQKQLPEGTLFSYANDPFRGATVAPMAANIQWDLYRKGSTYLVRMLYNEKQTAFKHGCRPVSRGSLFYDLDELESCYGYSAASSAAR